MRKSVLVLVSLMVIFSSGGAAQAEEGKFQTTMILQQTWGNDQDGIKTDSQELITCWNSETILGGLEVYRSQDDYLRVRPILGRNVGPWSLYLGGSFDSEGNKFLFPGINFFSSFGDMSVLFMGRQYFEIEGSEEGFTDLFLKLGFPLSEKFFIGVEFAADVYWGESGNIWFLGGPVVGYNVSERLAIFARIARDWTFSDSDEECHNDGFRVGLVFNF